MNTKNTRKTIYHVRRHDSKYYVFVEGVTSPYPIRKTPNGWYACTMYHKTLRDAIIFCAYGV